MEPLVGSSVAVKPRAALRRLVTALAGFAFLAALAATAPARAADESGQPRLYVEVEDGLLTVRVGEVPLDEVLRMIGEHGGFKLSLRGKLGLVRPQSFSDLPLHKGIQRLAGNNSLIMIQAVGEDGTKRLAEVKVYGATALARKKPAERVRDLNRPDEELANLASLERGPRLRAVRALARRKDASAISALALVLADDRDATVRRIAATALGNIGGEQAAASLIGALADEDPTVRIRATRGLRMIKGADAAPMLGEVAMGDRDPEVRRLTIHLLGALDSPEARRILESAMSDPDPAIREAAKRALANWSRLRI